MPQKKSRVTKSPKSAKKTVKTVKATSKKVAKRAKKNYDALALTLHKKLHGKIGTEVKGRLKTKDDWSTMYTPGVAAVSAHLAKKPKDARLYTIKRNTVAVVSDGSAVLGLGNVGPLGALPVMEGKCAIFKEMADVDAFPIVLDTQDPDEIVETVKRIAPGFGGVNLEDIGAPNCFAIEVRLKEELDIPVMHDDQHGTAVVVLAGLINAAKVVEKKFEKLHVVIVGAGAAGHAIARLLQHAGIDDIVVTDSNGIIYEGRQALPPYKKELARITNPQNRTGEVLDAADGADVLIGVSGPGTISKHHIEKMAPEAIIFALANPIPEIKPEDATSAGAAVVATGRSDYPNQVNNALAFPGLFRGALDAGVRDITDDMKLNAAKKIASLVKKPTVQEIIPSIMTEKLATKVARAFRK